MLKEFREFALRGSVFDMAIGIIIGVAFGKIVSSFVSDVLMPPIGFLVGSTDFSHLALRLSEKSSASIRYGVFVNTIIDFAIVAFVVFLLVKAINRLRKEASPPPLTKECPYCVSAISIKASRCPHCTSEIKA